MAESLQDEELTLAVWEGDKNAIGAIVIRHAGALQFMIRKRFPRLSEHDAEDVVCEGIRRFWAKRGGFDGKRSIRGYVYGFVLHVALEHTTGKVGWQRARNLEVQSDDLDNHQSQFHTYDEGRLLNVEQRHPKALAAIKQVYDELSAYEQDLWYAFAFGGDLVNAAAIGEELGRKHKNGIAVPQGNIRAQKKRLIEKVVGKMTQLGFSPAVLEKRK